MRDHDGATILLSGTIHYCVLCTCGWSSDPNPSQDAAELEHAQHAELAALTPADFLPDERP